MDISAKRLNKLTKLSLQGVMGVLEAGLPEFNKVAMANLKDEIETYLSDIIESHVNCLTQDEYCVSKEPAPF